MYKERGGMNTIEREREATFNFAAGERGGGKK